MTEQDEERYAAIMAGRDAAIARELDQVHAENRGLGSNGTKNQRKL